VKSHISKQSDLDIDVEDSANIILGFKGSNNVEFTASLNLDFIRHDTTRKCFVIGEKGTLLWDGICGKVKYFAKGDSQWNTIFSSKPDRNFTYIEEIKSFFSSIESNKPPYISGYEGLQVVNIVEAIKKSSNIDSTVYL
jgi:predicted dehydrogenase